jgi:hypothetical protein
VNGQTRTYVPGNAIDGDFATFWNDDTEAACHPRQRAGPLSRAAAAVRIIGHGAGDPNCSAAAGLV